MLNRKCEHCSSRDIKERVRYEMITTSKVVFIYDCNDCGKATVKTKLKIITADGPVFEEI